MITTMRRTALMLATLAAVVGTALCFTPTAIAMTGAHTSEPAHRSVGGIVVGAIVLAILIGTSYLLHRRRQRRFRGNEPDEPDEPRG